MLRPCLGYGGPCPTGAATSRTRCADCQRKYEAARPPRRTAGRYDWKYMQLRKIALARQPWCSHCHSPGTPANPLTTDHVVPLRKGGKNVMSNLDVLCRACNSAKRDRLTPTG